MDGGAPAHRDSALGVFARFGRSIGLAEQARGTPHLLSTGSYYDPERWQPPFEERPCLAPGGFYDGERGTIEPFSHLLVAEHMRYSRLADPGAPRHPWESETVPDESRDEASSYAKATRYKDRVVQLGQLADLVLGGDPLTRSLLAAQGASTWLRQFTRLHRPVAALQVMRATVDELRAHLDEPTIIRSEPQTEGDGFGAINTTPGQSRALGQDPRRQDRQLPDHHAHRLERLAARRSRPAWALGGELRGGRDRGSRQPGRSSTWCARTTRASCARSTSRAARRVAAIHVRVTGASAVVRVVCLGNPWHGDDGFGPHLFRRLRQRDVLPPAVEPFDAGIAGLDVLPLLDGCAKAVIVDAVRVGASIGTLHRLVPSDLEPPGGELSQHELGLSSLLAAVSSVSRHPPEVVVIGAQVGSVRAFTEALSAPLQNALSAAVAMVVRRNLRRTPSAHTRAATRCARSAAGTVPTERPDRTRSMSSRHASKAARTAVCVHRPTIVGRAGDPARLGERPVRG